MGNVLHGVGEFDKLMLMKKAYEALPEGGALVVIEDLIDNERSENVFGMRRNLVGHKAPLHRLWCESGRHPCMGG